MTDVIYPLPGLATLAKDRAHGNLVYCSRTDRASAVVLSWYYRLLFCFCTGLVPIELWSQMWTSLNGHSEYWPSAVNSVWRPGYGLLTGMLCTEAPYASDEIKNALLYGTMSMPENFFSSVVSERISLHLATACSLSAVSATQKYN